MVHPLTTTEKKKVWWTRALRLGKSIYSFYSFYQQALYCTETMFSKLFTQSVKYGANCELFSIAFTQNAMRALWIFFYSLNPFVSHTYSTNCKIKIFLHVNTLISKVFKTIDGCILLYLFWNTETFTRKFHNNSKQIVFFFFL